jgi:hypothetical protein
MALNLALSALQRGAWHAAHACAVLHCQHAGASLPPPPPRRLPRLCTPPAGLAHFFILARSQQVCESMPERYNHISWWVWISSNADPTMGRSVREGVE